MYLSEQYMLYRIAYSLVNHEGYDILYINNEIEEVWLEKYSGKTSKIIRLLHKGFDWKNHLKNDIQNMFHKINQMRQLIMGKNITIHNVYISSHPPVDDWEALKRPLQTNKNQSHTMHVYYFSENNNFDIEFTRLQQDINTLLDISFNFSESEKDEYVNYYKYHLANIFQRKKREMANVFSYGKPALTYFLIVANVIMFFLLEANGGSTNIENLIRFGAKFNPNIINGEWWRIISSMFLHIGIFHLFMNMFALYYLGTVVERIYGSWRFIIIYFFAGIGGGITSFAFSFNVSAGASGAIFGLFGALLFFGLIHKKIFFQTMGRGIITIIVINIVFGILVPQIDMGAHLGGLIAGFLTSAFVHLPRKKRISTQLISLMIFILLCIGLVIFGIDNSKKNIPDYMMNFDELFKNNEYIEVIPSHMYLSKSLDE